MATDKPPSYSPTASTATSPLTGPIVFVIGPPGSGKSTLCSRLCQQNPDSFRHLSVGDYLRKLCDTDVSEFPSRGHRIISKEEVAKCLKESRLLPPDTIIPLIQAKLFEESSSFSCGWLIDGFPRDIETALAFEKEIKVPLRVVVVHCDLAVAQERFLRRQRSATDDQALFEKRLKEYDDKVGKILDHYQRIITDVHTTSSADDAGLRELHAMFQLPEYRGPHGLSGSRTSQ